jgi:cytochrome c
MSRFVAQQLAMIALALATGSGAAANDPNDLLNALGRRASPSEIAAVDITVFPDGSGLPNGRATAREGRLVYGQHCAACHGDMGQGNDNFPALAGGVGSLSSGTPLLTVGSYWPYATTLWDYTRRAMPYPRPGSLTPQEVYAVTAYVLYMNGIVEEDSVLDQRTLPGVRMPNRDGFISDPRRKRSGH